MLSKERSSLKSWLITKPGTNTMDVSQSYSQTGEEQLQVPIDTLIDQEVIDMVMSRFKVSEQDRKQHRMVWDQAWRDYRQVPNRTGKKPWQSSIVMPLITKSTEVITANMHGAIMGPEVPVEWQSRGRPDLDEKIQKHNRIIAYDFDKADVKVHWTDFLRQCVLLGTSIARVDYVKEMEQVMVKERRQPTAMDSIAKMLGKQPQLERFQPQSMLVKDYARFTNVDLYDIYPEPNTFDVTKDMWIIEKSKITNKQLIDGANDQDEYYRLNVNENVLLGGGYRADYDPEKQQRRLAFLDYNVENHFLEPDQQHDLYEYWGPIPAWFIDPALRDDSKRKYDTVPGWLWVIDGQWLVRKRISPWRDAEPPYVKGNYIRIPNSFYGIGIGELLGSLQIEATELRAANIDNINMFMNKITAVLKDRIARGEAGRLVSEPGALWMFEGVDDIRKALSVIDWPQQGPDVWNAQAQIDREAQEVSGATKATLSVGGQSSEAGGGTFRGQLLNMQQATERFMLYSRVMEFCALGKGMKKFYQRIYQFKNYQEIMDILGPNQSMEVDTQTGAKRPFELIAPEILEKVAKLVPLGTLTIENKGVKIAQMNQFTQTWLPFPFFKQLEMARKQWIEMGFPEPDSVLFSEEEMKAFNDFKKNVLGQGGAIPSNPMSGGVGPVNPFAGGAPGPTNGEMRGPTPPNGPGVSPLDVAGMKT